MKSEELTYAYRLYPQPRFNGKTVYCNKVIHFTAEPTILGPCDCTNHHASHSGIQHQLPVRNQQLLLLEIEIYGKTAAQFFAQQAPSTRTIASVHPLPENMGPLLDGNVTRAFCVRFTNGEGIHLQGRSADGDVTVVCWTKHACECHLTKLPLSQLTVFACDASANELVLPSAP